MFFPSAITIPLKLESAALCSECLLFCMPVLSGCSLISLSGQFGVVYKAHLQWHLDAATEVVAVKTLKGIATFWPPFLRLTHP